MGIKSLSNSSGIVNFQKHQSMLAGIELNKFHHLETVRLGFSAASVEFTNLGEYSDYQHLQLRGVINTTSSSPLRVFSLRLGDNGSLNTSVSYSGHTLYTNGSSISTNDGSSDSVIKFSNAVMYGDGNEYTGFVIDILDPFESTKNTTLRGLHGTSSGRISLSSGLFLSLNPITNLAIGVGGSFDLIIGSGSRFSLYGLKVGA